MIPQELPGPLTHSRKGRLDRASAAVEMALVLPVLLFLLMGMIDFGRAYNAQIQLSAAAREGVRLASLNTTGSSTDSTFGIVAVASRVTSAAGGVAPFTGYVAGSCPSPTSTSSTACITYCPPAATEANIVVTSSFSWITGLSGMSKFFGSGFITPTTLSSKGVMRCAG